MTADPSENTKALLLLTAPLIVGRSAAPRESLTLTEYNRLARLLHELRRQPADLLGPDRSDLIVALRGATEPARIDRLLARGFLLSQAIERWQSHAVWVTSRADASYPQLLKSRLREQAPPILYGCGMPSLLEAGGLAVVGSRDATPRLIDETETVGHAAAAAGQSVVSGGARGIDQAAMRGALEAGGKAIGVLGDGLLRVAVAREHREFLMQGRLVLVTPSDPSAGFHVGTAMQRNKLIYALADAALVMAAEKPSGTWSGAEEQLRHHRFVPVFTRASGDVGAVLHELQTMGAKPWPNPSTPAEWTELLAGSARRRHAPEEVRETILFQDAANAVAEPTPAEQLFEKFRDLVVHTEASRTANEIATLFGLALAQTNLWLKRLVEEGVVEKLKKPARFRRTSSAANLFSTNRRGS